MASGTSSAAPKELFRYADRALAIDGELLGQSASLAGALEHFASTCTEPEFQVSVAGLDGNLSRFSHEAEPIDGWVRWVGLAFANADKGASLLWDRVGTWIIALLVPVVAPVVIRWPPRVELPDWWPRRATEPEMPSPIEPEAQLWTTPQRPNDPHPGKYYGYGVPTYYNPFHAGIDYAAQHEYDNGDPVPGDPIRPIGPGTIVRVRENINEEGFGYGWYVVVEHELKDGRKIYSVYAHLQDDPGLKVPSPVGPDDLIGEMGKTGTGIVHLHFELRTALPPEGLTIDPEEVFGNPDYDMKVPQIDELGPENETVST